MQAGYAIAFATAAHVEVLPDIESRAAVRFAGRRVPRAALTQTTPLETLAAAQADGRLWVALSRAGDPVGFGLVEPLGTRLHLEELDVLPEHGGLGIGTALVETIEAWARAHRFREVALTSFRDVPWNAPFYQRLGYEIVAEPDLDAVLLGWLQDEGARGLDRSRRVALLKRLGAAGAEGKGTEISLREAGTSDAAAIAAIHEAAVRGAAAGAHYGKAQIDAWAQPHALSRLRQQIGSRRFLVAAAGDQLIAYAQLDLQAAVIRSVYVLPSFARKGVGRRLTQTLIEAARDAGLERLEIDSSLNAVPFYEALGFRRLEEVDHELRGGVALRCVRMEKLLVFSEAVVPASGTQ